MIIGHWLRKVVEALRAVAYETIVASTDRIQTRLVIDVVVVPALRFSDFV
jgi:hypothetical protein|tara:strand:+ start:1117 stop:1266 length:150 start_codon:yes stop_codon:yes gene_type:complete